MFLTSPGENCGCAPPVITECEWGDDSFSRANNTNLGPDWVEEEGEWTITGLALRTEDINAQCIWNHDQPQGASRFRVIVDARASDSGSKAQVIVGWTNSGTLLAAEVEFGVDNTEDGCGVFRLLEDGTPIHEIPARGVAAGSGFVTITVEYNEDDGILWAAYSGAASNPSSRIIREEAIASGLRVGLGSGDTNGNTVEFRNFFLYLVGDVSETLDCGQFDPCGGPSIFIENFSIVSPGDASLCDRVITDGGGPGPYTAESFIEASDYDLTQGMQFEHAGPVGDFASLKMTWGDYVAQFSLSGSTYTVTLTGPGISTSDTSTPTGTPAPNTIYFVKNGSSLCVAATSTNGFDLFVSGTMSGGTIGPTVFVENINGNFTHILKRCNVLTCP